MQNEAGDFVDIYIPRRCAVTNRLIGAKDHASIQLRFVELDPATGRMTNEIKTYDIAGEVRSMVGGCYVVTGCCRVKAMTA